MSRGVGEWQCAAVSLFYSLEEQCHGTVQAPMHRENYSTLIIIHNYIINIAVIDVGLSLLEYKTEKRTRSGAIIQWLM